MGSPLGSFLRFREGVGSLLSGLSVTLVWVWVSCKRFSAKIKTILAQRSSKLYFKPVDDNELGVKIISVPF